MVSIRPSDGEAVIPWHLPLAFPFLQRKTLVHAPDDFPSEKQRIHLPLSLLVGVRQSNPQTKKICQATNNYTCSIIFGFTVVINTR